MEFPILYVLAGPNGIGKTTSAYDIIPERIPIINSDEIIRQIRTAELVKVNAQEYSNREAQRLVKEHLDRRETFAIETNLSDEETWKFLMACKNRVTNFTWFFYQLMTCSYFTTELRNVS